MSRTPLLDTSLVPITPCRDTQYPIGVTLAAMPAMNFTEPRVFVASFCFVRDANGIPSAKEGSSCRPHLRRPNQAVVRLLRSSDALSQPAWSACVRQEWSWGSFAWNHSCITRSSFEVIGAPTVLPLARPCSKAAMQDLPAVSAKHARCRRFSSDVGGQISSDEQVRVAHCLALIPASSAAPNREERVIARTSSLLCKIAFPLVDSASTVGSMNAFGFAVQPDVPRPRRRLFDRKVSRRTPGRFRTLGISTPRPKVQSYPLHPVAVDQSGAFRIVLEIPRRLAQQQSVPPVAADEVANMRSSYVRGTRQ